MLSNYWRWRLSLKHHGWLRWKLRRTRLRIKCFLTGGHEFSPNEWGYSPGDNVIEYDCPKCYTTIKRVPIEDFAKKDLLFDILSDARKTVNKKEE